MCVRAWKYQFYVIYHFLNDQEIFLRNGSCFFWYAVDQFSLFSPPPSRHAVRLRGPSGLSEGTKLVDVGRFGRSVQSARNRVAWRERRLRDSICRSRERVSVDISSRERPVAESARARVCGRYAGSPVRLALVGGWFGHPLTCVRVRAQLGVCLWR